MKKNKKRIIVLSVLVALVSLGILIGMILAKYTVTWDKEFGLRLVPAGHTNVLTENLGDKIFDASAFPDTEHIVFGFTSEYEDVIENDDIKATKKHVGSGEDDLIYMYYDDASKTTYVLCEDVIYFHPDSSEMFAGQTTLLSITYENANTTLVTDMSAMYQGCIGLTELDLSCFDTGKVTNMTNMFMGCENLATVYAKPSYITEQVITSNDMFIGCYNLVGGEGTEVYMGDATETTMPLDKTYARIDGLDGEVGYFTDKLNVNAYFRSNILKDSEQNAAYTVYGKEGWLTIANGLDSKTYSTDEIEYKVTYYIQNGEEWVQYKTAKYTFEGNKYCVQKFELKPISRDGNVYNTVKVVANNLSGLEETIEAIISFEYEGYEVSYGYENGVIYLTIVTNDDGGKFEADIHSGVAPDNSDPNQVFTTAEAGPTTCEISLHKHTEYEFCFFVTDAEVIHVLAADGSKVSEYVEIKKK